MIITITTRAFTILKVIVIILIISTFCLWTLLVYNLGYYLGQLDYSVGKIEWSMESGKIIKVKDEDKK